jgi:hypothetical protein
MEPAGSHGTVHDDDVHRCIHPLLPFHRQRQEKETPDPACKIDQLRSYHGGLKIASESSYLSQQLFTEQNLDKFHSELDGAIQGANEDSYIEVRES